eukprot:TRINITY_DN13394_c0_g1_i4.p1 TRINITY_DN13394_c0_g1~~TRINITY_DN13394_c0_g1_i4.p1  ORF type:complete len:111 (+),score=0.93 TRINITY_DN13394_c0_g1_i4:29-334(+)
MGWYPHALLLRHQHGADGSGVDREFHPAVPRRGRVDVRCTFNFATQSQPEALKSSGRVVMTPLCHTQTGHGMATCIAANCSHASNLFAAAQLRRTMEAERH